MTRRSRKGLENAEGTIGESIAHLRTAKGLTQSGLARIAGTTQGTISDYERGKKMPRLRTLERLVHIMGWKESAVEHTRTYVAELRQNHSIVSAVDRLAVPGLAKRLAKYSLPTQKALVSEATEFKNWGLAEYFCLRSSECAGSDPKEAAGLADLALILVDHLGGEEGWLSELRAFVWPHVGNAFRVAGDFGKANDAFGKAEQYAYLVGSPSGLLCQARAFALKASLRRDERRLHEALALLEEAFQHYPDQALRPQLLMSKANVFIELENLDAAIRVLGQAEALANRPDPRLDLCLRHNLLDCLSRAGRFEEAIALVPEVENLARTAGLLGDQIRLRWVKGRIAAGVGEEGQAVELLTGARAAFALQGMSYDVALVSLELAAVYMTYGRTAEVKALARHLVPIFTAQEVHEEAKKALGMFRHAAEKERATLELLQRIVRFLERVRRDPNLRFEG